MLQILLDSCVIHADYDDLSFDQIEDFSRQKKPTKPVG